MLFYLGSCEHQQLLANQLYYNTYQSNKTCDFLLIYLVTDMGSGRKFVLELDEPGDSLPDQTRKYVAYFSEDMNAVLDASGLSFSPVSGQTFNGRLVLATWVYIINDYVHNTWDP